MEPSQLPVEILELYTSPDPSIRALAAAQMRNYDSKSLFFKSVLDYYNTVGLCDRLAARLSRFIESGILHPQDPLFLTISNYAFPALDKFWIFTSKPSLKHLFLKSIISDGKLVYNIGYVEGDLELVGVGLTTLSGCPYAVNGNFKCSGNLLTTLEGCPGRIGGGIDARRSGLVSLAGFPASVGGDIILSENNLLHLQGLPERVYGNFDCSHNKLTSLVGCPTWVDGDCNVSGNKVNTLLGAPKSVGQSFFAESCGLTSTDGLPVVGLKTSLSKNYLTTEDIAREFYLEILFSKQSVVC